MLIMAGKTTKRIAENEKKCLEYYENWKSASYAAKEIGINRHTVEKYYQKFRATELEQTTEDFIARQRMSKDKCLQKLDEMIDHLEKSIERYTDLIEDESLDVTADGQRVESQFHRCVVELAQLYQQKGDIESTATLDIKIAQLVSETYEEYSKQKTR